MDTPISISNIASISALGTTQEEVWQSYRNWRPLFKKKSFIVSDPFIKPISSEIKVWVSEISSEAEAVLQQMKRSSATYKKLDRSVLLAIMASKEAFLGQFEGKNIGVNIGSSRGATSLFEGFHEQFLRGEKVSAFTSPTTTLGNISSWVGQELNTNGVTIGHSVTCSTALHAVLNGIAWLQADMADAFVVGGSEAALTPFTIAQMKAMKLYSNSENDLACESMKFQKEKNTMVLGEASAVAVLEKGVFSHTQAIISGYGFASEKLTHNSSISENASCFQKSMKMALQKANLQNVDAIVMHAPGTVKGDVSELNAIKEVFGNEMPLLTSNKWLVGHTFGASGMLSLEMAVLMLKHNQFIENPYFNNEKQFPKQLKTILVNAVGFGGNAVSIIVSK
ncbi:beta-ketoacyl synthase N-terminal-like domain-containing protein [Ulvibacter litoralis]|uniref:3-oxoacyl-(Acyl-carrier-protein) synthase n=1 Tax=Ulvibacter litoralis TaxID=227084 RepID=A0A1G7CV39_9FLAO|nr:beta-ketoacyl synthase N-terminal-like domain-containing protein [Ulvibacter litoralis]GHC45937.1 beta-ketoacyl synthase [Ulvibacter litoralis]SDE43177.1 3-oxoacyl-(acyl-carrier-protein) synthase [Ulvibacter litoralis]